MHKNRKARKDTKRYKTTLKFECFCQLNERKNYQYYKPTLRHSLTMPHIMNSKVHIIYIISNDWIQGFNLENSPHQNFWQIFTSVYTFLFNNNILCSKEREIID